MPLRESIWCRISYLCKPSRPEEAYLVPAWVFGTTIQKIYIYLFQARRYLCWLKETQGRSPTHDRRSRTFGWSRSKSHLEGEGIILSQRREPKWRHSFSSVIFWCWVYGFQLKNRAERDIADDLDIFGSTMGYSVFFFCRTKYRCWFEIRGGQTEPHRTSHYLFNRKNSNRVGSDTILLSSHLDRSSGPA